MATTKAMDREAASRNGTHEEARKPKERDVKLFRPKLRVMTIPIRQISVLVMNKMSEKSRNQMLDKQKGEAKGPREVKNPEECFRNAMHLMPGAKATDKKPRLGFPASGFRKAMIGVASMIQIRKGIVKGAVFVQGDDHSDLVEIKYDEIRMRQDDVRLPNGSPDIRFRPELRGWSATLKVIFDASMITPDQILNLAARAGFSNGIGEGRPEKEGEWGQFEIEFDGITTNDV